MSRRNQIKLFVLMILVLIAIVAIFSSCSIERLFQRQTDEKSNVAKQNESSKDTSSKGNVRKEDVVTKSDFEWWRTIFESPQSKGDTSVNNINVYQPPARVIIEGGRGTVQENKSTYDSTWQITLFQMFKEISDSNSARTERIIQSSKSETKGLGILGIALIAGAYLLIQSFLQIYLNKRK